jgi:hypothetical protein
LTTLALIFTAWVIMPKPPLNRLLVVRGLIS